MEKRERERSNLELYKIYKQPDILKFVKLERLKWAGHVAIMNEDRCCKKIFLAKRMGNKPRTRSPLRWIDCVEKDLKDLKVKNWGKQLPKVGMLGEKTSEEGQDPHRVVESFKKLQELLTKN
ncbi:putative endonuclease-reverse transcriptase [Trichonephila clavipes]|nr:putative endonuclease-reverse transcriptase [Trichonephila clavipes]